MKKIFLVIFFFASIASYGQLTKTQLGAINARDIKSSGAYSSLKTGKLNDSTYLSLLGVRNNLSDLNSASTARTNLGLGSLAILNTINNSNWSGTALAHSNIAATAVTPGSYTNANITVAADGSITAASNGSGGGTVNSGTTGQLAYYASNGTTLSGTTALPNGTTATTQAANDNSTKVATTAYADNAAFKSTSVGLIYSDNFARASLGANYTTTGSTATFACDGTKLNISGGIGTNTEYIIRNTNYSNAEDYTIKTSFKVIGPINGTSFGSGIIVKSNSSTGNANNFMCSFDGTNAGTQGRINFYFNGGNTLSSTNGLAISVNDVIDMTLTRNKTTFSCTIYNETTKLANNFSFTYSLIYPSGIVIPPAAQFGIFTQGGVYQVGNVGNPFSYTNDTSINADFVWITDSILSGYFNGAIQYRPASLLQDLDKTKKHVVYGVQGTTTTDMVNCLSEITALVAPGKVVLMNVGKNDASNSTAITNMGTIKTAVEALGARVIFISIVNNTTLNGLIISTYPSNNYVDIYSSLNGVPGVFADGTTHFSRLGALKAANNIYTSCRDLFSVNAPSFFDEGNFNTNVTLSGNMVNVTTTYTVLSNDTHIKGTTSGGAFTITLPPAATSWNRILWISKADASANLLTLKGNASETIDGANTFLLPSQNDVVGVQCDAANSLWKVISVSLNGYLSSSIASGSAVSLTTATTTNVTSITLNQGTWDVDGAVNFSETTATVTARQAGITSTTATIPSDGTEVNNGVQSITTTELNSITVPSKRFTVATGVTTPIYLVARPTFSAGTVTGYGTITARRIK